VSDLRRPPEWGRIADPDDIFGSVEVDSQGQFVGENGGWQDSGTYRLVTRDGMSVLPSPLRVGVRIVLTSSRLGLSPFLMERLVAYLTEIEQNGGPTI